MKDIQLQTRAKGEQKPSFTPVPVSLKRRCTNCPKKRRLMQRQAMRQAGSEAVPPIVHEVLRSPGQSLDRKTREFMEPRLSHEFSRTAVHSDGLQASASELKISPANDSYEQEAEKTADKIMRTPQDNVSKSIESPAGFDFSQVKVHTGAKAAESAQAVGALAYTVGHNIVFNDGAYAPETHAGKRLLAHELNHVLQQEQSSSVNLVQRQSCDPPTGKAIRAGARATYLLNHHRSGTNSEDDALMWFDDWAIDNRDNDIYESGRRNNIITIDDDKESGAEDGSHFPQRYRSEICSGQPNLRIDNSSCTRTPVWVKYRVCIDVPIGSYHYAGMWFPLTVNDKNRHVNTAINGIRAEDKRGTNARWRVMRDKGANLYNFVLQPGDFLAIEDHHSAIYGGNSIINLPGPSRGNRPSGDNDIRVWSGGQSNFNFIARPIECTSIRRQGAESLLSKQLNESHGCEYITDCPCKAKTTPVIIPSEKVEIQFNKDAPQWWYDPASSFKVSLTPGGRAAFEEIVAKMESQPALRVQLEGRASSDRPANDEGYNRRLTDRRVRLIASELEKRGIPKTRLDSPADQSSPSGCEEIDTESSRGLLSCGDEGAKVPPDPSDRKVVASLFQ